MTGYFWISNNSPIDTNYSCFQQWFEWIDSLLKCRWFCPDIFIDDKRSWLAHNLDIYIFWKVNQCRINTEFVWYKCA